MPTYVVPPDNRADGAAGHLSDHAAIADDLEILGVSQVDWLNVVTGYGADNTGATDVTAAVDAAIATVPSGGKVLYLPAGIYLANSTAWSSLPKNTVLAGDGIGSTVIKIGASFSGAQVINIAGGNVQIRDLTIQGASTTIASNPACNGIEIQPGSLQYTISNVFTQYINGYGLEAQNDGSSPAISHSIVDRFWSFNCAGGIHYNGDQRTANAVLSNITIGNGGTASGPNANLDAILLEDVFDLTWVGINAGVGNAGTGHCIHIKGNCSALIFNSFNIGGFPTPLANSQCGAFIEDAGGNHSVRIMFSNGLFQTFGQGAQVDGASQQVSFSNVRFRANQTHGCTLSGTGTQINFTSCTFDSNGAGATGSNYDLNNSGTAQGTVRDCHFLSTTGVTVAAGAGVQKTVNIGTTGTALNFEHCDFRGTLSSGSYLSQTFTNQPHIFRDCANINPFGAATVAVPASGVATGALHYDAFFYITADPGGGLTLVRNSSGQGGGSGPTVTIAAGGTATVFVAAAENFTPTYTNAPTWVVDGQ